MAPQLTQAKTNKAGPVISKHVVTLRAALQKVSKTMEEINEKFYPQITHLDESGHQTNVFYNPKELNTDITLFREYAFSVMLDFAFAHGMYAETIRCSSPWLTLFPFLDNSSYMSPTLFKDLKLVFEVIRRRSLIPIRFYKYGIRDSLDRQYDKTISDLKTSIKRIIEDYNPEKYKQDEGRMSTMLESLYIASQEEDEDNADNRMRTATKAAKRVPIDDIVGNLITAIIAGYGKWIIYCISGCEEVRQNRRQATDLI
jgi:hypothetical protein